MYCQQISSVRNTKGISKDGRNTVPDVKLVSAQQNEKNWEWN